MNEWFTAYSSSLLDCTRNTKTLKQEHTVQNQWNCNNYLGDYAKFFKQ